MGKTQTGKWVGQPMRRREDDRLLRGAGRYVADLAGDALWIEVLRSPYAMGTLEDLSCEEALQGEGVVAVLTAKDFEGLGQAAVNPLLAGTPLVPMQVMAETAVLGLGQPLAAVVARSALQAKDAAELIAFDITEAAPETNLLFTKGDFPCAPEGAVAAKVDHALLAPFAMEPRAALAEWDGRRLTCHLSTQTPQRCREDLARILGLSLDQVRVIAPDVGGAFGGKASLMPEDVICARAALLLQAKVAWTASRSEEFLAATRGRGTASQGWVLCDAQGMITKMAAQFDHPLGYWMPYSALAPANNSSRMVPWPYSVGQVFTQVQGHLTPEAAVNIYRGAGRPEAVMLTERLMERAARAQGLDPLEFRLRNVLSPQAMPVAGGPCSGDFAGLLHDIKAPYRAALARAVPLRRGVGLALYAEPCGMGWESAALRLEADGMVTALTGSSAQGQGRETALAQLVAEELAILPEQVRVVQGDTDQVPRGIGALASRSTAIGGSAMLLAARRFRRLLQGESDLAALAARLPTPLEVREEFTAPMEAWASGVVLAEVEIDPDTGALTIAQITWIDDAGHILNPLLVEGQMIGGAAQGIGAALMEAMVTQDGQLLTGSLMDYALPRATDMPPIKIISRPTPTPANPLGARGVGEAGCIGVPAAILNAVMQALPADCPDLSLPLTPEKVWRALNGDIR